MTKVTQVSNGSKMTRVQFLGFPMQCYIPYIQMEAFRASEVGKSDCEKMSLLYQEEVEVTLNI